MSELKSLPIGIQTFELMISGKYLYIDKTAHICNLIKPTHPKYFLSRPRRFGKSSLLSTLEAYFQGKKDLFKGLAIEKIEQDWLEYPVIRIDVAKVAYDNEQIVCEGLIKRLVEVAKPYEIVLNTDQLPHEVFNDLINAIVEKMGKKLVILIDEYDSVIVNQLHNHALVLKYFEIFRKFYQVTKLLDDRLQFVFVTGVTNFAKANMFSGLNHLDNISFNPLYSEVCGYTQNELEHSFSDYIEQLSEKQEKARGEILREIKEWYNGYQFMENTPKVYNPFSVLQLFNNGAFKNFWYQTGTPNFLVQAISKKTDLQPNQFENYKVFQNDFDTLFIEKPDVLPLLFQTGYLTIKNFDPATNVYELGYPNQEVRDSFLKSLLVYYSDNSLSTSHIIQLRENIQKHDIDAFMETMQVFPDFQI